MELDSSPSKRRKLSPTSSVTISQPKADNLSQPRKDGGTTPTFMSPTKSSLARFNPALLSPSRRLRRSNVDSADRRRKSVSPLRIDAASIETSARAATASPTRAVVMRGSAALPEFSPFKVPTKDTVPFASRKTQETGIEGRLNPPSLGLKQPRPRLSAGLGVEREDSTAAKQRSQAVDVEGREPELPPTPEQLGLQPPSDPPKGLSSSSPLKSKSTRGERTIGSSPLKPRQPARDAVQKALAAETLDDAPLQPAELRQKKREQRARALEGRRKQRELEQVLKQCQELQSDIDGLREIIDSDAPARDLAPPKATRLLNLLTSKNASHVPISTPPRSSLLSAKISAFLPFTKPARRPSRDGKQSFKVLSYAPIDALDPPTYQTAFTPFVVTATKRYLGGHPESSAKQVQHIELTSPKFLLLAKLKVTSDAATGKIDAAEVSSVSSWANPELGQWLRMQASTGDIPSMGWACGRFWEVAGQRARHWLRCQATFSDLCHGEGKDVNDARERQTDSAPISRRALAMNMGRRTLLLSRANVRLLLSWDIVIDSSGEITSEVDASAAYPKVWQDIDERGSLKRIKEVFHRLRERDGLLEATRVIVRLLFPG